MMGTQLALPARWAYQQQPSYRDAREHLDALRRDINGTKAAIRDALDALAERHGISPKDVDDAMAGYADDLLSDVVYSVENQIEREIEDGEPL
jgi:hypothetical protein